MLNAALLKKKVICLFACLLNPSYNRMLLLCIVVLSLLMPLFNIPIISNALSIEEFSVSSELNEAFGYADEDMPIMEEIYAPTTKKVNSANFPPPAEKFFAQDGKSFR